MFGGCFSPAVAPSSGLGELGIQPASKKVHRNLSYPEIAEHERARKEGQFTANGTFAVDTGEHGGHACPSSATVVPCPAPTCPVAPAVPLLFPLHPVIY